jgi:Mlc titration factor MtfA (ptsG expression regulator)
MIVYILQVISAMAIIIVLILFVLRPGRKKKDILPMTDDHRNLLDQHVAFYQQLDPEGREKFEQKVQHFLANVRITGVKTTVEDLDRVLIGASAIIPIYAFPDWEYINLNEVLLYPDAFSHEFEQAGEHRSVAGMVGTGPLQNVMVISKQALRHGFSNNAGNSNTAIHEFIHLIDKTDGAIDGIPEVLLKHQYTLPWVNMMREKMEEMMRGESDIDLYGVSNQAEFFAVVSEYFFNRPDLLQEKHPALFTMLERIFLKRE